MRGSEAARLSFATALARCSATDAASLSMVVDRRAPGCWLWTRKMAISTGTKREWGRGVHACDWWSSTTEVKDRRRLVSEVWCGRRRRRKGARLGRRDTRGEKNRTHPCFTRPRLEPSGKGTQSGTHRTAAKPLHGIKTEQSNCHSVTRASPNTLASLSARVYHGLKRL